MKLTINEGTKGFISPNAAAEYYYDYGNYALWPDSIIDELQEKGYDRDFIDEVFFIMNSMLDDDEAAEEDRYGFDYEDDFEKLFDEGCYKNRRRKQLDESVPAALMTLKNQLMNKLGSSFIVKGGSLTPKVTVYSEEEPDTTFDITTDGKNVEITPKYNGIADTVHKKKGIAFMRAANVLYDFIMSILSGGRKLATEGRNFKRSRYTSIRRLKEDSLDDIGFDYRKRYISNVDNQCKFEIVQCLKQLGIRKYDFIDEPQLEFACQLMIESDFETYKKVLDCLEQEDFYAYR